MKDIVIYGAGGFGREIASLIKTINLDTPTWRLVGFIDDGLPLATKNRYGEVIGDGDCLNMMETEISVFLAIANPAHRQSIVERITNKNINWPNLIAPDVKMLDQDSLQIGKGNIIFYSCRISCDVSIGDFNLMNSLVSFGHDVGIGSYNVLMPSTRISGETTIGNGNFFGVNSLVLQGLKIGSNTRIGAASVVMRNTKDNFLYFGNPARMIKE
ncbi:MAG: acetyltransferase [Bacteroidales bacterium]